MSQRILTSMAMAAALAVGWVAPVAAQEPVRVGGDIKEPRRIHDVKPVYPRDCPAGRRSGHRHHRGHHRHRRRRESAGVLRPVPLLDQAALDAVTQWRYAPTLLNGQPVTVVMTVTVTFSLNGQQAAREVNPDPLVMQRPADDVAALLDYAKALQARGLLAETEKTLERALALVQAERARAGAQAAASTANPKAPVRVGGTVAEPALLKRVDPVYPAGTVPAVSRLRRSSSVPTAA